MNFRRGERAGIDPVAKQVVWASSVHKEQKSIASRRKNRPAVLLTASLMGHGGCRNGGAPTSGNTV